MGVFIKLGLFPLWGYWPGFAYRLNLVLGGEGLMQFNVDVINSALRHVATYVAGAITAAATFHLMTTDQAQVLSTSLSHIVEGLSQIAIGVGPIIALVSAFIAARSSTPAAKVQSVSELPGTTVVTTPAIATALPQTNVVSNTEVKVVPK